MIEVLEVRVECKMPEHGCPQGLRCRRHVYRAGWCAASATLRKLKLKLKFYKSQSGNPG